MILPFAMMLEYVYFDFSPFGNSKLISNLVLGDFLNYMDRIDGFEILKIHCMARFAVTSQMGLHTCTLEIRHIEI